MALVNYDSSDDDLQDSDDCEEGSTTQTSKATKSRDEANEDPIRESKLFSSLPAPKASSSSQLPLPTTSLNDIIVNKTTSGAIRITVPSLKHYSEDNDSDEELKKSKRMKKCSSGTGLSSLLPKPKNTVSITSKSLMPQSLIRPKPNIPAPKLTTKQLHNKSIAKNSKQIEDNSHPKMDYFFIDEKNDKNDNNVNENIYNKLALNDTEYGPKPQSNETFEHYVNYETSNPTTSSTNKIPSVDDITYKKLIASKFGEESAQDIEIIDIDVSKHLSDSKDWLKTISEEKEEPYNGVVPTSTARRKHQITFLAFQAKQREVELKNQWANNKLTKNQSRSKYGF